MDGLLAARLMMTVARIHLTYDEDLKCWVILVD